MISLAAVAASRAIRRGDKGEIVKLAQLALRSAGAELNPDGDYGSITEQAVRRFQAAHTLLSDGVIGVLTGRELDEVADAAAPRPEAPLGSALAGAPWLSTMRAITGNKEVPGEEDSPFVLGMAATIAQRHPDMRAYCREYAHDSVPWCGLTIAYVMAVNGIRPVTKLDGADFGFLWADDWKHFGVRCEPRVGAVGVFTRNGGGHVSLIEGVTPTHLTIRGGNQSDMVNVTTFPRTKLTDTRWPAGWPVVDIPGVASNVAAAGKVT